MYLILTMVFLTSLARPPISEGQSGYNFLIKWGTEGNSDGQFMYSRDVAIGCFGNIYVADAYNNRIQKFTPDGVFVVKWGEKGRFDRPLGVAIDDSGSAYVADTGNNRVQKFIADKTVIAPIAAFAAKREFHRPIGK